MSETREGAGWGLSRFSTPEASDRKRIRIVEKGIVPLAATNATIDAATNVMIDLPPGDPPCPE